MGFWSSLGRGLLKAAPIAAAFIPGIGPLASAGIGAGIGALSGKVNHTSVLGGALGGAASGALGGAVKGLGPSNPINYIKGDIAGVAKSGIKSGILGTIGDVAKKTGTSILKNPTSMIPDSNSGIDGSLHNGGGMINNPYQDGMNGTDAIPRNRQMRGLGPIMGQSDQSNPNLAESIGAGRQTAIMNQPFRQGYQVNYLGSDDETPYSSQMPPIYPNMGGRRNKKLNQNQPVEQ